MHCWSVSLITYNPSLKFCKDQIMFQKYRKIPGNLNLVFSLFNLVELQYRRCDLTWKLMNYISLLFFSQKERKTKIWNFRPKKSDYKDKSDKSRPKIIHHFLIIDKKKEGNEICIGTPIILKSKIELGWTLGINRIFI